MTSIVLKNAILHNEYFYFWYYKYILKLPQCVLYAMALISIDLFFVYY